MVDVSVDGVLGLNILVWGLCHCLGVKEGSVTTFPPRSTHLARSVISASIASLAEFPLLFSCLSIGRSSFLHSLISAGNCSFIPTFEPLSVKAFLKYIHFVRKPRKFDDDGSRSTLSEAPHSLEGGVVFDEENL